MPEEGLLFTWPREFSPKHAPCGEVELSPSIGWTALHLQIVLSDSNNLHLAVTSHVPNKA